MSTTPIPLKQDTAKAADEKLAHEESLQQTRTETCQQVQDEYEHVLGQTQDQDNGNAFLGSYSETLLNTNGQTRPSLQELIQQLRDELTPEMSLPEVTATFTRLVTEANMQNDMHMQNLAPLFDDANPAVVISSLLKFIIDLKESHDALLATSDFQAVNNISLTRTFLQTLQKVTAERDMLQNQHRPAQRQPPTTVKTHLLKTWGSLPQFINGSREKEKVLLMSNIHDVHTKLFVKMEHLSCNQCSHCNKYLILPPGADENAATRLFPTCWACIGVLYCSADCKRHHRNAHSMCCHPLKYWEEEPNSSHYHAHTMPRSSSGSAGGASHARATPPPRTQTTQRKGTKGPCRFFNDKGCDRNDCTFQHVHSVDLRSNSRAKKRKTSNGRS